MKKYIFEYVGGSKGDMVVRFLNGVEPDISFDRANKTEPQELGCVNWLKLISARDMTLERFEEVLSVNPYEYVPAHPLWCCCPTTILDTENLLYSKYMDLLKKYNYEIISLKFEPKHYVTVRIESILKSIYKLHMEDDTESVVGVRSLNGKLIKRLSLEEAFRGGPVQIFTQMISPERSPFRRETSAHRWPKKFNEMTNDRTLFHYDDLFRSDSCPFPEHSHREDEWLMLVEQSWCDYDENGYRKFEVPEGCE